MVCVVDLLAAIFDDQRIKVLGERGEILKQVSKTVFGHLDTDTFFLLEIETEK